MTTVNELNARRRRKPKLPPPKLNTPDFDPDTDIWYTTAKVAEMFEVTRETVTDWIQAKKLPAIKQGKRWLIRRVDVIAYVNSLWGAKQ